MFPGRLKGNPKLEAFHDHQIINLLEFSEREIIPSLLVILLDENVYKKSKLECYHKLIEIGNYVNKHDIDIDICIHIYKNRELLWFFTLVNYLIYDTSLGDISSNKINFYVIPQSKRIDYEVIWNEIKNSKKDIKIQ